MRVTSTDPISGNDVVDLDNPPYVIEGNWEFSSSVALDDGVHEMVFSYEDRAGNRDNMIATMTAYGMQER